MTATTFESTPDHSRRRFANAAEWHHSLGDVPLERIIVNPPPGTATEADLLRLVQREKRLCELVNGTLVEKSMGFWEGQIAARLIVFLSNFADPRDLGSVFAPDSTMRMRSGHVRLPDVSFIAKHRLPTTRDAIPSIAPDLVIEVLSVGNTKQEIGLKIVEYFQSGTRLAWIIDPDSRTVAIYHQPEQPTIVLDEFDQLSGDEVLPELKIQIAELFRGLPK